MPPVQLNAVGRGLVEELQIEEEKLGDHYFTYLGARAKYEVAARKYAAVRDVVIENLGYDPYVVDDFRWPDKQEYFDNGTRVGEFHYLFMKPGPAVVTILKAANQPLALADIHSQLQEGKSALTLRNVNAALMNTSGVKKQDDMYVYESPEDEW